MNKTPPPLPRKKTPIEVFDLEEVQRYKNLLIFAQSKVEGYFSGKHKSPYYGSNVEFADYKEYSPGEDVSNVDWRVYGRTRRLFLRKFEEETDMVVYLLVDASGSMLYSGTGSERKFQRASRIAAVLAYLMIHQGDKASLTLFADKVKKFHPPGGTRRHLHSLISELESAIPSSRTGIGEALEECASIFNKRGRIVILSDFLGDSGKLFEALGQFTHRKYEVMLMQVLDPDELELPSVDIAQFIDMESGERIEVEPDAIRRGYRETMQGLVRDLAAEANRRGIQHSLIQTRDPYFQAVEAYIGFRSRKRV